ncbi:MAG: hypothetical protein IKG11_09950 [Atopobiaceae bacterium]|nr:hypothetical protein [Atopobiaceae bacterium]
MSNEIEKAQQDELGHPEPPASDAKWRMGFAAFAMLLAVLSFFVLAAYFANPATYASTISALDAKRNTVMNLMGASTGSSAAISLLPGDVGTPIAEKLVDLSSDFLVVIAAIYLEKYLLTVLGVVSFRLLIPIGLLLVAASLLLAERIPWCRSLMRLGSKLALFGLISAAVVPASVYVSGMIESTYQASIDETIKTAEQTTEAIESSAGQESDDSSNPLQVLLQVPEELNKLTESARNALNNFVEALAVMIVTSCVIPILVLLFFVWLARLLLGINIDLPAFPRRRGYLR